MCSRPILVFGSLPIAPMSVVTVSTVGKELG